MFRLAHLTDPHVGPLPRPRLRQLLGKRATGYVNWRRGRKHGHDMDILAALVADLRLAAPDHIACTGDLCNIGLPSEWATSRVFLEALGEPEAVSFVPGNHDAYVRGSLAGLMSACGAWAAGDGAAEGVFPYLRRRGDVAVIGLSTAIPTRPFIAAGRLGAPQIEATERMLRALAAEAEPPCRVILIHHPPQPGGASSGRELKDAAAFTAMIGRAGAELILHGHNHVTSLAFVDGAGGARVPVVGAPSASAGDAAPGRSASYMVYAICRAAEGFDITMTERGFDEGGAIEDLRVTRLAPPP